MTLRSKLALGDFFKLVDDSPVASALLEAYARDSETVHLDSKGGAVGGGKEREMLKDFYWQDDRRREGALLALDEAALAVVSLSPFAAPPTGPSSDHSLSLCSAGPRRAAGVHQARGQDVRRGPRSRLREQGARRLRLPPAAPPTLTRPADASLAQIMDEAYRLLSLQQTIEKESEPGSGVHVVGLSVNETMSVLLKKGLAKKADRVRADFKVPDRRCASSRPPLPRPTTDGATLPSACSGSTS